MALASGAVVGAGEIGAFIRDFGEIRSTQEPGGAVFSMPVEERHLDASGYMAMGALLAFADHAVGNAGIHVLGVGQVTIQLQLVPLAPVAKGQILWGTGEVVAVDDDILHLKGRLWVENLTVATVDGRWKLVRRR